jgi:hypothetical protein
MWKHQIQRVDGEALPARSPKAIGFSMCARPAPSSV